MIFGDNKKLSTSPHVSFYVGSTIVNMHYRFALDHDWLQPYLPHSLTHSAAIIADHVDFWEEERFKTPDGFYRPRILSDFISNGFAADTGKKFHFKSLLEEYISLASETLRPAPGEQPFHITRRLNVNIAIADARMWLDELSPVDVAVGSKRPRDS